MRFRLLGIPITVDWFFWLGLVLVWSWAGGDRGGLFAAVFVGALTVVHELAHALTAKRFGAASAITLNLLVGWASYAAPRPLSRRQRNSISLAGPLAQIVASLPVLYLAYAMLQDNAASELGADMWVGMVWAGIIIGLLNLVPLWPLDGGHVVDSFLGGWLGERKGRRAMLIGTLVATGVIVVLSMACQDPTPPFNVLEQMVIDARNAPSAVFTSGSFVGAVWEQVRTFPGNLLDFPFLLLIFCGVNSYFALRQLPAHDRVATWMDVQLAPKAAGAPTAPRADVPVAAREAERLGWLDGAVPPFPSGWGPSPWVVAHHRVLRGDMDGARSAVAEVTRPGRPRWTVPDPAGQREFALLVALLPDPLPRVEDPSRSVILLRVLAAHGSAEQIAHYGVAVYAATADPEALYLTAAGLARSDRGDDAMAWLRRAAQDRPDHHRLATDRGLWPLHARPDFQQLLAEMRSS